MDISVEIKKLRPEAQLPTRGSQQAAGYDLHACLSSDLAIAPGATVLVGTGLAFALPQGYFGGVFARSGLSVKQGLRPANCVGVIDSDYRGEIKVVLYNHSDEPQTVSSSERIAQIVIAPYIRCEFEDGEIDSTDRGAGGFGSTGK